MQNLAYIIHEDSPKQQLTMRLFGIADLIDNYARGSPAWAAWRARFAPFIQRAQREGRSMSPAVL